MGLKSREVECVSGWSLVEMGVTCRSSYEAQLAMHL